MFDCNWLQVHENQIDHYHTALLHNNMTVEDIDQKLASGASLSAGFGEMPVIDWHATHDGNGMIFTAGRRLSMKTSGFEFQRWPCPTGCRTPRCSACRNAVSGKSAPDPVRAFAKRGGTETLPRYPSDSVLRLPRQPGKEEDRALIREAAHQVFAIMKECDVLLLAQRRPHVLRRLDEIEQGLNAQAQGAASGHAALAPG